MSSSPVRRSLGFACAVTLAAAGWAGAGCSSKSQTNDAGGNGGNGGADTGVDMVYINPLCFTSPDNVISDFTLNNGVKAVEGRSGGWYTYADKSGFGTLVPAEGTGFVPDLTMGNPTCSGPGSMHVTATNFTDWGAAMGVDIAPKVPDDMGAMVKGPYDASKFKGIAFWAKAAAPVKFVQVKFTDPWTDIPSVLPTDQRCVFDTTMPTKNCSPWIVKFGYGWEATPGVDGGSQDPTVAELFPAYADFKIDTDWKRFVVMFADAKQDNRNPGQASPTGKLDTTKLMSLGIQVNSDHATMPPTANDFEIWIDDVVFVE